MGDREKGKRKGVMFDDQIGGEVRKQRTIHLFNLLLRFTDEYMVWDRKWGWGGEGG